MYQKYTDAEKVKLLPKNKYSYTSTQAKTIFIKFHFDQKPL